MRRFTAFLITLGASVAFAALGPRPTPNLFWNETLTGATLGMIGGSDYWFRFLHEPPDPIAGNTESVLERLGNDTAAVGIQYYGSGFGIRGDELWGLEVSIDGMGQPIPDSGSFYNGDLAWGFHAAKVEFPARNTTQVRDFTLTRGMETNAPTIDAIHKTTVNFVEDGKPNTETPYVVFPWEQFTLNVLTETPVLGGQVPVPFEALQFMNWSTPHAEYIVGHDKNGEAIPMFILPPANTSYLAINATLGPTGAYFYLSGDPHLPGLGKATDFGNMFSTYSFQYWISNAPVYGIPLDPKERYNITLKPAGSGDMNPNSDPILSSITFYSALWDGDGNSTTNNTLSVAATPRLSSGAIAGAAVGSVVGVLLIVGLVFILLRRKRQKDLEKKWNEEPRQSIDHDDGNEEHKPVEPYILPAINTSRGKTPSSDRSTPAAIDEYIGSSSPSTKPPHLQEPTRPLPIPPETPHKSEGVGPRPSGAYPLLSKLSGSTTRDISVSPPSPPLRQTEPIPDSQPQQEEDVGLLEEVMSEDGPVPPSYNPLWEEDARRRGKLTQSTANPGAEDH